MVVVSSYSYWADLGSVFLMFSILLCLIEEQIWLLLVLSGILEIPLWFSGPKCIGFYFKK